MHAKWSANSEYPTRDSVRVRCRLTVFERVDQTRKGCASAALPKIATEARAVPARWAFACAKAWCGDSSDSRASRSMVQSSAFMAFTSSASQPTLSWSWNLFLSSFFPLGFLSRGWMMIFGVDEKMLKVFVTFVLLWLPEDLP